MESNNSWNIRYRCGGKRASHIANQTVRIFARRPSIHLHRLSFCHQHRPVRFHQPSKKRNDVPFRLRCTGGYLQQRLRNAFGKLLRKVVFVVQQRQMNVAHNRVGIHKHTKIVFECLSTQELRESSMFFHGNQWRAPLNTAKKITWVVFCTYINGPDTL